MQEVRCTFTIQNNQMGATTATLEFGIGGALQRHYAPPPNVRSAFIFGQHQNGKKQGTYLKEVSPV